MALGDGASWDETTPTDSTVAINIDDYNRDLRVGTRSRMALEHEWPSSQSATSEAGRHKYITLQEQSTAPALTGTQVCAVYMKTVATTGDVLYYINTASAEIPLSIKRYFWYLDGALATGTNVSARIDAVSDGVLRKAYAYLSTVSDDLVQIDVNYDGTSVWTATASQILITTTATGSTITTFVQSAVTAGGYFTIDVDKMGTTGGGLTVFVEVW